MTLSRFEQWVLKVADSLENRRQKVLAFLRSRCPANARPFNRSDFYKAILGFIFGGVMLQLFTNLSMAFYDPYFGGVGAWTRFEGQPVELSYGLYALFSALALISAGYATICILRAIALMNGYVNELREKKRRGVIE